MSVLRSLLGIPDTDGGRDFPPPPPPKVIPHDFREGDSVIVTTACEDIMLHELTGVVSSIARTGSIIVKLDVDDSHLPFLPHEIGHRY